MVQPGVHMTGQLIHKWRPVVIVHSRRQAFRKSFDAKDHEKKYQEGNSLRVAPASGICKPPQPKPAKLGTAS